jgi:hypothetical protein
MRKLRKENQEHETSGEKEMNEEKKTVYERYSITVHFTNSKYSREINLFDMTYAKNLEEFFDRIMSCINRIRSDDGVPTNIEYTKTTETRVVLPSDLFLDRYYKRQGMIPKGLLEKEAERSRKNEE